MLAIIEIAAICAFAVSGLIEAVRKRMDVVGVFTVAFVTAFGGGTLRDLLLDRRPLSWVQHQEYVWLVLGLTLAGPPLLGLMRHRWADRLMQATDAIGLGLFAASGAAFALAAEMPIIVVVLLGVVTGCLAACCAMFCVTKSQWSFTITGLMLSAPSSVAGYWWVWIPPARHTGSPSWQAREPRPD